MRIALIALSYLPNVGRLQRHVDQLARGLARRGADVEIFTHGRAQGTERLTGCEGVLVRRFPTAVGPLRFAVAPRLWDRLRFTADAFDVVDVHTGQPALALGVARAGVCTMVFTPYAPIQRLTGWPYAYSTRAVIGASARVVCSSKFDAELLSRTFPHAAPRVRVAPLGVDAAAIRSATPFDSPGRVVVAVGRLERAKRVDRAIAAMASLDPDFRLVIVGDGPARHWLQAYAADLRVSTRVHFVGSVPDAVLYRWLRTARVLVTLPREHSSASQMVEAAVAGACVVASDIPVHREAAAQLDGRVVFVAPEGSPLEVADAISEAARLGVTPTLVADAVTSWDSVVDWTTRQYGELILGEQACGRGDDQGGATGLTGGDIGLSARIGDSSRVHTPKTVGRWP